MKRTYPSNSIWVEPPPPDNSKMGYRTFLLMVLAVPLGFAMAVVGLLVFAFCCK